MSNLPSKFTPHLWEGWSRCSCGATDCESIVRKAKGGEIGIVPENGQFTAVCKTTYVSCDPTSEAWARGWAEGWAHWKLGGWE